MAAVVDALGREVSWSRSPHRVVSLVPSETLSVCELAGPDVLVGVTDYCIMPECGLEHAARVGGTKGFSVERVADLGPDLVLANKEENSETLVRALIDAGLRVHVSFPCSLDESLHYLESLATILGSRGDSVLVQARSAVEASRSPTGGPRKRVFVPIWRDPWMTFGAGTYADAVLAHCGGDNVFAERVRQYPLAADLGRRAPWPAERTADRDTRYPRVTAAEITDRAPDAILLPDEPYAFTDAHARELRAEGLGGCDRVQVVDGKDLFWYGTYMAGALGRLSALIDDL